ncbi:MAG: peptidoglycan-binding protein [Proteobacteria bacterium]|nr:peptidoglycan-binding protein [Pseudomonadota bacterium]
MRIGVILRAAAASAMAMAFVLPALAPAQAESIKDKTARKVAEIPTCTRNLGTIAVREPENKWWEGLGLESPEALLKVFVQRSGCFTLVVRGKGFEMIQQERDLAGEGQLQNQSNMGKGQLKAADYILIPDIASKNNNANGTNVGGVLGGLIGGGVGAIVSNISINSKTADVVLSIANVRTGEMGPITEGHGSKTDIGFGVGAGWANWSGGGGAGVTSYQNTGIGQVVALAYIDAYTKLVEQMGGLGNASTEAPAQALNVTKPGHCYAGPKSKSKVLRSLSPGTLLYPTANREGVWYEVKTEQNDTCWVSSQIVEMAK